MFDLEVRLLIYLLGKIWVTLTAAECGIAAEQVPSMIRFLALLVDQIVVGLIWAKSFTFWVTGVVT